jgi:hypothetical protein
MLDNPNKKFASKDNFLFAVSQNLPVIVCKLKVKSTLRK